MVPQRTLAGGRLWAFDPDPYPCLFPLGRSLLRHF